MDITSMTRDEPLFKTGISLDLKSLGSSTQLHEIHHTVQVVFGYFITKILYIVHLNSNQTLFWPDLV